MIQEIGKLAESKGLRGHVFWDSPKIRKRYRNYEQSNGRQPMAGRMVKGGRFYIEEAVGIMKGTKGVFWE